MATSYRNNQYYIYALSGNGKQRKVHTGPLAETIAILKMQGWIILDWRQVGESITQFGASGKQNKTNWRN